MKMDVFAKHCVFALTFLATVAFTACDDQNFDWEKAKSQNAEYNYAQRFESLFGNIDPNQAWDFSTGLNGVTYSSTRANIAFVPENCWSSDYYQVQQSTLTYIGNTLKFEDQDNTPKGTAFSCVMPDNDFDIIPVFQGRNSADILRLYMDVAGYGVYQIWRKGQNLQKKEKTTDKNYSNVGTGTDGTFINSTTLAAAIQGKKLTVSKDCFDAGSIISFYTQVRNGTLVNRGNRADYEGYTKQINNRDNYLKYYFSTRKPLPYQPNSGTKDADKPYILAMTNCPTPTNVGTTNGIPNQAMLIACEGGGDRDLNDVIFLFVGRPYLPKVRPVEGTETITKRYMVEDMGYSDPTSSAALNNYTDIDFNDIVIDFQKSQAYRDYFNGSTLDHRELIGDPTYTAKVRALGGTWDFILYLKNGSTLTPIFQKSKSTTSREATISPNGVTPVVKVPQITMNPSYPFSSGRIKFEEGNIYNTGQTSQQRGDNHYRTKPHQSQSGQTVDESWLCTFTLPNTTNVKWIPDDNNIVFQIVDDELEAWNMDYTYGSSGSDSNNVYFKTGSTLNFPAMGAMPKIVAFDENKPWQREKVHVVKSWFKNNSQAVDEKGDYVTTTNQQ